MSAEAQTTLREALSDVLERMAFMFAEETPKEELAPPEGPALCAQMSFKGHGSGTIRLWVPQSLCPEMAANVLGLEPDDELCRERGIDALKELLNVTCGKLLTDLYGERYVFDLTPPETTVLDEDGWRQALADETSTAFTVEDRPVLVSIRLTPGEASA